MNYLDRKTIYRIILVMCPAILIVILLAGLSKNPLDKKSGFNRRLIPQHVSLNRSIEKDTKIWHISGANDSFFFLQGVHPNQIFRTDLALRQILPISLPIKDVPQINTNFQLFADFNQIWLFAKNAPAIIKINPSNQSVETSQFPANNYTRVVKISNNTFIFRGFDSSLHSPDQIFLKGNLATKLIEREQGISELKHDAGFSTDGLLHYDSLTKLLTYVFFYSDKFICLDTNLHVVYRGNTIDTLSTLQTKSDGTQTGKNVVFTNTTPSRLINMENCVNNGILYNYSKVKGDNETTPDFSNNSAIDMYDIRTGIYKGSFYIPNYKGEKLTQFRVEGNSILTLYKHYIVTYLFRS